MPFERADLRLFRPHPCPTSLPPRVGCRRDGTEGDAFPGFFLLVAQEAGNRVKRQGVGSWGWKVLMEKPRLHLPDERCRAGVTAVRVRTCMCLSSKTAGP